MTAKEVFKKHYGQSHPMTQHNHSYFKRGKLSIEVADGTDMNKQATSVTVLEEKNNRTIYRKDLSGMFSKRQQAKKYIDTL